MMSGMRWLVEGTAAMVAIVALLGVLLFVVLWGAGDQRPQAEVVETMDRLLVSSRTHLSLRVDGAGGASVDQRDIDVVSAAVDRALATLSPAPSEFGRPSVSLGCPARYR